MFPINTLQFQSLQKNITFHKTMRIAFKYVNSPSAITRSVSSSTCAIKRPLYVSFRTTSQNAKNLRMSTLSSSTSTSSSTTSTASSSDDIPTPAELNAILTVARSAARAAGAIMREHVGKIDVEKEKASYQDLVTAADRACQETIEGAIHECYPTHDILGEESVPAGALASTAAIEAKLAIASGRTTSGSSSGSNVSEDGSGKGGKKNYLWVIDPIDGTTNFVAGIPCSVVSIGIAYGEKVVAGVIYEPYRDELFEASYGQGAYCNGKRVHVTAPTATPTLQSALFGYGLHHTHQVGSIMCRGLEAVMKASRGCRSLGSAALHLAYVSCGRLTGFWELDLSSWDIAAGSILVTEAGGKITDTRGNAYSLLTRDCFASNGASAVHDGVLKVLAEVDANSVPR